MLRINLLVWALVFYDQNKQSNYKDRGGDGVILDSSMVQILAQGMPEEDINAIDFCYKLKDAISEV